MKLVEVIRTPATSEGTFQALIEFGKSIDKTTVECKVRIKYEICKMYDNKTNID